MIARSTVGWSAAGALSPTALPPTALPPLSLATLSGFATAPPPEASRAELLSGLLAPQPATSTSPTAASTAIPPLRPITQPLSCGYARGTHHEGLGVAARNYSLVTSERSSSP